LARHIEVVAQLAERLPIVCVQQIQQLTAAGIGQRLEKQVRLIHAVIYLHK
jgi:hypothetical protein